MPRKEISIPDKIEHISIVQPGKSLFAGRKADSASRKKSDE